MTQLLLKKIFYFLSIITIFYSPSTLCMEPKETTVFVSSEVLAENGRNLDSIQDVSSLVKDVGPKVASILKNHPSWALYALQIAQMGIDIAKSTDEKTKGMGNLVSRLSSQLAQQGYGSLSEEEQETIMKLAVVPQPREAVVKLFDHYGKTVNAALVTNQDEKEYLLYDTLMKEKGVNISKIMRSGIVTTPYYGSEQSDQTKAYHVNAANKQWLVAHGRNPSANYAATIRELADQSSPNSDVIVISRKKEITEGLEKYPAIKKTVLWNNDASQLKDLLENIAQDKSNDLEELS